MYVYHTATSITIVTTTTTISHISTIRTIISDSITMYIQCI